MTPTTPRPAMAGWHIQTQCSSWKAPRYAVRGRTAHEVARAPSASARALGGYIPGPAPMFASLLPSQFDTPPTEEAMPDLERPSHRSNARILGDTS